MRSRILVLTDDLAAADRLADALGDRGYDVARHHVCEVVLSTVTRFQPHLIILDGFADTVPNGTDFMQTVWLAPATAATRFIVTASPSPRLRAMHGSLEAKGIAVVYKPYRLDQVLDSVRAQLQPT